MSPSRKIRSLLIFNLAVVFLPVLLVQLPAPTLMRGRTSPLPGGAFIGAVVVLLLIAALWRVAYGRARRVFAAEAVRCSRNEALTLGCGALAIILLGQSLFAGLAEVIGVVRRSGNGSFSIDYARYVVITSLAYVWTVTVLTLLSVSLTLGAARALAETTSSLPFRGVRVAAALAAAAAIIVLILKVVQHLA